MSGKETMVTAPPVPHWRQVNAFGLPAGSVRALLAVMIFGGIWAWLLLRPDFEVPQYLQNLLFIIMGHYFAVRRTSPREQSLSSAGTEAGPPPLFLPHGTIRLLLVGGFVAVAVLLFQQEQVWVAGPTGERIHKGAITLLLVAGFLLGVVVARVYSWWSTSAHLPRWLEDLRALLSLSAAVLLLLLVFDLATVPDLGPLRYVRQLGEGDGLKGGLAAVVGFYFGSRS
jgi:hypothetical protein